MKLYDAFKSLPQDMILKSRLDGQELPAFEWAERLKFDPSEAEIGDSKSNYGKVSKKIIYFPGIGPAFIEWK